jgi:L-lysine exporter family protein LysE/ArgO
MAAGIGGAVFLIIYGTNAFRSAIQGGSLPSGQAETVSLKAVILTTLAVTLLNPHVYLDTVILLGSISSQFQKPGPLIFGAGAVLASFIWFFSLSLGGKLLAPVFASKRSWRILDTLVGSVMWAIALSILSGIFSG